ncbi:tRNA-specific 2-thiouridylase [Crepidotus variabilis]|uniref:tRNA-5-taurinomethyluridine 2-sulfurtransferase n=1 Tax=Crepidotus variabilis TaxID=179855 RepID=A0A9P6EQ01_9AGAR|nr:tRNA-specific 2-thiouridylase [Crepidotus variabilis]
MSGGVDSSVTAMLLARQDFDLSAVYMRNWDTRDESGTDKGCEWEEDWEDVQLVCKKLGIPCEMADLSKEYWNRVFEPALRMWEHGVTPNPDVWCNREIKFGALFEHLASKSLERAWFATGHYAAKAWSEPSSNSVRPKLIRPVDRKKDQTYFLSAVSEASLSRTLFPLGHLTKPEVRELAKQKGLSTAERPDSVGICFVGEKAAFNKFLSDYLPTKPGPIVHKLTGKVLGEHQGLWQFTVGQNLRWPGQPKKLFVSSKDTEKNIIYAVPGSTHYTLMSSDIRVVDSTWIWPDAPPSGIDTSEGALLTFVPRYRSVPTLCKVRRINGKELQIQCDELQHAITPGQIAAFYDGDWCIGSGMISSSK